MAAAEADDARGLRERLAQRDEEIRRLREELAVLHASAGPSEGAGDVADLRSRFAINRLLWQNKLQEQEKKEKERLAELATLKLSTYQRKQATLTRQLWAEQLLRKTFVAWATAVAGAARRIAQENASRAALQARELEQISTVRGRELDRLSQLERRWQASAERATDELVKGCVRLKELQNQMVAIAGKTPLRLTSHGPRLRALAEELEGVAETVFGAVHHELLWAAYGLGEEERRAADEAAAAEAAQPGAAGSPGGSRPPPAGDGAPSPLRARSSGKQAVKYVPAATCKVALSAADNPAGEGTCVDVRIIVRTRLEAVPIEMPTPEQPKRRPWPFEKLLSASDATRAKPRTPKGADPESPAPPPPRRLSAGGSDESLSAEAKGATSLPGEPAAAVTPPQAACAGAATVGSAPAGGAAAGDAGGRAAAGPDGSGPSRDGA